MSSQMYIFWLCYMGLGMSVRCGYVFSCRMLCIPKSLDVGVRLKKISIMSVGTVERERKKKNLNSHSYVYLQLSNIYIQG